MNIIVVEIISMNERMVLNGKQRLLVLLVHLSYFIGGLGFVVVPLVVYLLTESDAFVRFNAKQALVSHLALVICGVLVGALCVVLIGFLLVPVLAVLAIIFFVCSIIAAVRGYNGQYYYYPFIQRFASMFD